MSTYRNMVTKKIKGRTGNDNANQKRQNRVRRKASVRPLASQHKLSIVQGASYVKDMEFPADGPGRVIVRLERLMGSDRIRITDPKYMATLLQRLTEEEEITWQKRTRERRKAEHNRFRQLVIDGYTEPTPGMEDLYNHPVFRVNRILNRLNKLDLQVAPIATLPPIISVDPFKYDDSGRVFRTYTGHFSIDGSARKTRQSVMSFRGSGSGSPRSPTERLARSIGTSRSQTTTIFEKRKNDKNNPREPTQSSEYEDGENLKGEFHSRIESKHEGRAGFPSTPSPTENKAVISARESKNNDEIETEADGPKVLTIQELQKKYGVAQKANLGIQWKSYQSEIVEKLFHNEKRGVRDLYEMGTNIVNMYDRQQQTTNDYIADLHNESRKRYNNSQMSVKKQFGHGLEDPNTTTGEEEEEEEDELGEVDKETISVPEDDDDDDVPSLTSPYNQTETDGPPTWDSLEKSIFDGEEDDLWKDIEEDEKSLWRDEEDDDIWNVSDLEAPEKDE